MSNAKSKITLSTPETRAARKAKAPSVKRVIKAKAAAAPKNMVTAGALAAAHDIAPKTLRARIRRNADAWAPLITNPKRKPTEQYVLKYDAKAKAAIETLLA